MVLARLASYRLERVNSHVTHEQVLLDRARAYDPEALAELYDRYAHKMYAYIYRRVNDAVLAEDLTSELFLRMLRAIQQELEVIEQLYEDELDRLKNEYAEKLVIVEAQMREEITLLKTQVVHKDQQISDLNERVKEAHILLSQEQHRTAQAPKKKRWWEFWKRG